MTAVDGALAAGLLILLAATGFLYTRVAELQRRQARRPAPAVEPPSLRSIRQVGLVRYQAYHDVGGDHSFALALLDSAGDGVVLNSLYHRDRCRVYAKAVKDWRAEITLTDEEREAISRARQGAEDLPS